MVESPHYSYRAKPRFSVNQVADYLATTKAHQRDEIIRDAKFPATAHTTSYTSARNVVCRFLGANGRDLSTIDHHINRFDAQHRSLPPDSWEQKEAGRNRDALKAFKQGYGTRRWSRFTFAPGPTRSMMEVSGVKIVAYLDPTIVRSEDRRNYRGGCATFFARTVAKRKNIDERCNTVAALIFWSLQGETNNGNLDPPLEAICLSFDVFGNKLTTAPTAIDRLRANITKSCAEAFNLWPTVTPPDDYDGPPWR